MSQRLSSIVASSNIINQALKPNKQQLTKLINCPDDNNQLISIDTLNQSTSSEDEDIAKLESSHLLV